MVCLFRVLVCRPGRTHSKRCGAQIFCLYGWEELVSNQGRWQGAGSMPSPGAIIFFDWEHDGTCDHVGIVERCDGTTVYTIEGNSGDAVKERSYAISSNSIMGYGMVVY